MYFRDFGNSAVLLSTDPLRKLEEAGTRSRNSASLYC